MKIKTLILSLLLSSFCLATPVLAAVSDTHEKEAIPYQGADDLRLSTRVQEQLKNNVRNYDSDRLLVYSQSGQVTLQGRVQSQTESNDILKTTKKTAGVTSVTNKMIIDPNL